VVVGRQEGRRWHLGTAQHAAALWPRQCERVSAVTVEHNRGDAGYGEWVREWMRVQQQFERKVRAAIFYFYFRVDGSVAYWAVRAGVEAHKRVS
jgi:hypothetical protein